MAKRSKRSARKRPESTPVTGLSFRMVKGHARPVVMAPSPLSFISPLKKTLGRPTRPTTNHSRNSGEAARLSEHLTRVAAVPSPAEKRKPHSKLSLIASEPDARKSSDKAREPAHCKKKPDSKKAARSGKGGGVNKRFVPWCG